MNQKKIHIALVDDHSLFRSGIANLLREFNDIKVVFEAANGKELQEILTEKKEVDVILMDINMPLIDGYLATSWVKKRYPKIHVLALSMFDDDIAVIKMLKAGAGGYILKESKPQELYRAINEIKEKGIYLNELVSSKMLKDFQKSESLLIKENLLSEREIEFIKLCVSELTYKEIAEAMNLAPKSVHNYREHLFLRLKLRSRVGLVMFAIKNKLVDID